MSFVLVEDSFMCLKSLGTCGKTFSTFLYYGDDSPPPFFRQYSLPSLFNGTAPLHLVALLQVLSPLSAVVRERSDPLWALLDLIFAKTAEMMDCGSRAER